MRFQCFTILRIRKYIIHSVFLTLLNSPNCCIFFDNFICLTQRICNLSDFHLLSFQMCYLLLLAQVLLVIFEASSSELIFSILSLVFLLLEKFLFWKYFIFILTFFCFWSRFVIKFTMFFNRLVWSIPASCILILPA